MVIAFDVNDKAILIGCRETAGPRLWCWPLLPQHLTSPSLSGELRLLAPGAYDSQLDAIHRLHKVINSVCNHPTTLPRQPTELSACAALLERLGYTRAMDAMGLQYKIEFQYDTTAFMVTAFSKGGRLPFDPCQINLPLIPALVAFYHKCLQFLVKHMWLDTIKAGNCEMFAGLSYSNVAHYCPDSNEMILGHLAQTQQTVQSTKSQSTPYSSPPQTIKFPMPLAKALQEVFLHAYPISKVYADDTGWFPVRACLGNQYVMIAYHTDENLVL